MVTARKVDSAVVAEGVANLCAPRCQHTDPVACSKGGTGANPYWLSVYQTFGNGEAGSHHRQSASWCAAGTGENQSLIAGSERHCKTDCADCRHSGLQGGRLWQKHAKRPWPYFQKSCHNDHGRSGAAGIRRSNSTIVVMVDELTGDPAGARFVDSLWRAGWKISLCVHLKMIRFFV